MATDGASAKNVRDIKGGEEKPKEVASPIVLGNIPILQVQLLDAINKNLVVLVQQNANIIKMLKEAKEDADGRPE